MFYAGSLNLDSGWFLNIESDSTGELDANKASLMGQLFSCVYQSGRQYHRPASASSWVALLLGAFHTSKGRVIVSGIFQAIKSRGTAYRIYLTELYLHLVFLLRSQAGSTLYELRSPPS